VWSLNQSLLAKSLDENLKGWFCSRVRRSEKLHYEDVAEPKINETETLIRVELCALNHSISGRARTRGERVPMLTFQVATFRVKLRELEVWSKNHRAATGLGRAGSVMELANTARQAGIVSANLHKIIGYENAGRLRRVGSCPFKNVLRFLNKLSF